MADGGGIVASGRVIACEDADAMTLRDALRAGHVIARCRCGHREPADTSSWRSSAFVMGCQLSMLASRVRCVCGSREVRLEVGPSAPVEPTTRRTYVWRA